jgi:hypothetical protein
MSISVKTSGNLNTSKEDAFPILLSTKVHDPLSLQADEPEIFPPVGCALALELTGL